MDPICSGGCGRPVLSDEPQVPVDGQACHFACAPIRERLGVADNCTPPMSRPPQRPVEAPLSSDPAAIERLRRRS